MPSTRANRPHRLARIFPSTREPHIALIGCGGTGSLLAEMLCRLLTGTPATILLIDPDTVEPHNLLRQNFLHDDIGQPKSKALAQRLSQQYRRSIGHSQNDCRDILTTPRYSHTYTLTIGCVDNAHARSAMHQLTNDGLWWMDCGNAKNKGQVLLGNISAATYNAAANAGDAPPLFFRGRCEMLPSPADQEPDLLSPLPDTPNPDRDCAQAVLLQEQDPLINQAMALTAAQMTYAILTRTCNTMGVYLDTRAARIHTVLTTPANAARALKVPDPDYLME